MRLQRGWDDERTGENENSVKGEREREREGNLLFIYFWFNCIDGAWDWAGKWN